jgi:hypothetical protein
MGLRKQGGAWENGQQMQEASPRDERKRSALRMPLAPCPAPPPEATHNQADLDNKDLASNQRAREG